MKIGPDVKTPGCACVNCGKEMEGAFAVGSDAVPSPGDITICAECGHIMAFSESLGLRDLTDEEIVDVAGNERVVMIQKAMAMMKKERK